MPRLSSLQLQGVELSIQMCRQIQSLRTFSSGFYENSRYGAYSLNQSASQHLLNLTTINIELSGSCTVQLGPSVKQVNIRWTRPGWSIPREIISEQATWRSVRAIHVAQIFSSSADPPADSSPIATFAILETTEPYQTLILRTSGAPNTCVHARAIDREDRERVFCGLHPATVAGMVAQIPGHELSSITISTTAIALQALSNAQCPVLSCVRLVLDSDDIAWIDSFTRDMINIKTLERIEFSQQADPAGCNWTTDVIIRTISLCIAAGNKLQEVLFLGFSPEAHCLAMAKMFSQQVVVDQNWLELKNERVWFTEPPFEWR